MRRSIFWRVLKAAVLMLTTTGQSACGRVRVDSVEIGKAKYNLPNPGTRAVVLPPDGSLYVAVKPPGTEFELIHAARDSYRKNYAGADTPLVTHINDVPSENFEIHDFAGGKTVCRLDKPAFTCGLRVDDEGIGWTVIFEYRDLSRSSEIRAEALTKLRDLRQ